MSPVNRLQLIFFSLAVFFCFLLFHLFALNNRPFSSRGEAREALVAYNMFDQQNYILPLRNEADIPSKPPLMHWIALGAANITSSLDEFSIRLPSAFLSALTVAILFYFVSSLGGISLATLTTLILITSFEWNRSSGHARVDMTFACSLNIAFFTLFEIIKRNLTQTKINYKLWCLLSISTTLAILAKGPATVILLGLAILFYLLLCGVENRKSLLTIKNFLKISSAVLAAITLGSVWYYLAYLQGGMEFLNRHILGENFSRVIPVEGYEPGHNKPFYYSLIYLISGMFPWSLFFPLVIFRLTKIFKKPTYQKNTFFTFLLAVFSTFLFVVTLSSSKRDVYFLPAFPAMAYLTALACSEELPINMLTKKIVTCLIFICSFIFLAIFLILIGEKYFISPDQIVSLLKLKNKHSSITDLLPSFTNFSELVLIFVASLLLFYSAFSLNRNKLKQSCLYLALGFFSVNIFGNYFILPAVSQIDDPRQFIEKVRLIVPINTPLYQFQDNFFPVLYYAQRPIKYVETAEALKDKSGFFILVAENKREKLLTQLPQCEVIIQSQTLAANGQEKLILFGCNKENN